VTQGVFEEISFIKDFHVLGRGRVSILYSVLNEPKLIERDYFLAYFLMLGVISDKK
jgi:hypothetical protein